MTSAPAFSLDDLRGAVLAPCAAAELVPPPRFAEKTFDSYRLDASLPEQAAAVDQVRRFAAWRRPLWPWPRRGSPKKGLYLDGGFGVGKTHLLAASFAAAPGARRYLSFTEAISLVVLHGVEAAADVIAGDLVCIDEFELDDPANTRLIDLLLERLIDRRCRVVTTSNTVPGELGQGRLFIDQFRAQLSRISDLFADVHIPGRDHRRIHFAAGAELRNWGPRVEPFALGPGVFALDPAALDALLVTIPVVNLRRLAAHLRGLTITAIAPFTDQHAALRFVNVVDKLYDFCVETRFRTGIALEALFPEEHCQGAFAKKYQRCLSRLAELCS